MSTALEAAKAWLGDNYLLRTPVKRIRPKSPFLNTLEGFQRASPFPNTTIKNRYIKDQLRKS